MSNKMQATVDPTKRIQSVRVDLFSVVTSIFKNFTFYAAKITEKFFWKHAERTKSRSTGIFLPASFVYNGNVF